VTAAELSADEAAEQAQPASGDSPLGQPDGAGTTSSDKRANDLMGLANRRLTAQQNAERERDESRAEIDRLRQEIDDGYAQERAHYLQQPPEPAEPDNALSVAPDGAGEDDEDMVEVRPGVSFPANGFNPYGTAPSHVPGTAVNTSPARRPPTPFGSEPSLADTRAVFDRLAEAEDMRIRQLIADRR
jgi:hypothetical protein